MTRTIYKTQDWFATVYEIDCPLERIDHVSSSDNMVFVVGGGKLAVSYKTMSKEAWTILDAPEDVQSIASISDDTIYVGTESGKLIKIAMKDRRSIFDKLFRKRAIPSVDSYSDISDLLYTFLDSESECNPVEMTNPVP